ncbi:MAG: hypothetical protein ABI165_02895 [Bryobacteraceae bacterium]
MTFVCAWAWLPLGAAAMLAQTPLAALKADAETKYTNWVALHSTLESTLRASRSCDPAAKDSIAGVAKASDARLEAWERYLTARLQASRAAHGLRDALPLHEAELAEAGIERGEIQRGLSNIEVQKEALSGIPKAAGVDVREAAGILDRLQPLAEHRAADKTQVLSALRAADEEVRKSGGEAAGQPTAGAGIAGLIRSEAELWRAVYEARWVRVQVDCMTAGDKPAKGKR